MTEYELFKEYMEQEAVDNGGIKESDLDHIRKMGIMLTMRYGLTPEKVWHMTKRMRIFEGVK